MSKWRIVVCELVKTYRIAVREAGSWAAVESMWRRRYRGVDAVRSISFRYIMLSKLLTSQSHSSLICNIFLLSTLLLCQNRF